MSLHLDNFSWKCHYLKQIHIFQNFEMSTNDLKNFNRFITSRVINSINKQRSAYYEERHPENLGIEPRHEHDFSFFFSTHRKRNDTATTHHLCSEQSAKTFFLLFYYESYGSTKVRIIVERFRLSRKEMIINILPDVSIIQGESSTYWGQRNNIFSLSFSSILSG